MPDFEPVFLSDDQRLNGRMSMTFARHFNHCPRSAYLGRILDAGAGNAVGVELVRGSALHTILERCTRTALTEGEDYVPPDLAKTIVDEVLGDPALPVPLEEHDYIRESAYRWAAHTRFPYPMAAVETPFLLEVEGMTLRCRIDRADVVPSDSSISITDYKSSRWALTQEEVARKLPSGRLLAKSFQLVVYALAVKYGHPCIVNENGDWEIMPIIPPGHKTDRFRVAYEYPGIPDDEGRPLRRAATLTGVELEENLESLRALVRRVRVAEEKGQWPAVVSDAACRECPAPSKCPIPVELRDHRGQINTEIQAAEAMMVLDTMGAVHRSVREEVKRYLKATGNVGLRYGGKVFGPEPVTRRKTDAEGMAAAAAEAVRTGDVFDPAAYVKVSTGTSWTSRDMTEDERNIPDADSDIPH